MKLEPKISDNEVTLDIISPIDNKSYHFSIMKEKDNTWPVVFYTATSDIKDFIGNVTKIGGTICTIKGYYRGKLLDIHGIKIKDSKINKIGQRAMVTEHLSVEGRLELIATTNRIIYTDNPGLNFCNIGWSDESECHYLRIDVYDGSSKNLKGPALGRK